MQAYAVTLNHLGCQWIHKIPYIYIPTQARSENLCFFHESNRGRCVHCLRSWKGMTSYRPVSFVSKMKCSQTYFWLYNSRSPKLYIWPPFQNEPMLLHPHPTVGYRSGVWFKIVHFCATELIHSQPIERGGSFFLKKWTFLQLLPHFIYSYEV